MNFLRDAISEFITGTLAQYLPYIIAALVIIPLALGILRKSAAMLASAAMRLGDSIAAWFGNNPKLAGAALAGIAAALWLYAGHSPKPAEPAPPTAPVAASSPGPKHFVFPVGVEVSVMCPSCRNIATATGNGIGDHSACPRCSATIYTDEGMATYKSYQHDNPPLPEGKVVWCKCASCGQCYWITGDGESLKSNCSKCKAVSLVTDAVNAHAPCKEDHHRFEMYGVGGTLKEPKTQEARLRLELAKYGVRPPDEWRGEEHRAWQGTTKVHSLKGDTDHVTVSKDLKDRWNAFQRSLAGRKQFIDRWGKYSETEQPSDSLRERFEDETLLVARSGLAMFMLGSPEYSDILASVKRISYGEPGYDEQRNLQLSAVNRWNDFQAEFPERERKYIGDTGSWLDHKPAHYKLTPITPEQKRAMEEIEHRERLSIFGVILPDPRSESEVRQYESGRKELPKLMKSEDLANAKRDQIRYWNGFQKRCTPDKRTFYLKDDGSSTQNAAEINE